MEKNNELSLASSQTLLIKLVMLLVIITFKYIALLYLKLTSSKLPELIEPIKTYQSFVVVAVTV